MASDQPTYWFVFCSGCILLQSDDDGTYSVPLQSTPPTPIKEWTTIQELPSIGSFPCKTYSISMPPADTHLATIGLRESYTKLPPEFYNMAGKASELLFWDSNTKYCGNCGAPMRRSTVISKTCTHCGKEVWPQVAPAIIVRVRRKAIIDDKGQEIEPEKILLVNARNFRRSEMYGLVAGFLETGETLEDCVRRELLEETNIKVQNIRYFASQAWPYPCGVMIGFTADYESGEIRLQEEELRFGGWYSRTTLPPIPDKMSIARKLIDDWLEQK